MGLFSPEMERESVEERTPEKGRRLAEKKGMSRGGKIAIAVVCAVLALLVGGYLGLCAYASGDRVIPGAYMGDVDLSGLSVSEAAQRLEAEALDRYEAVELPIRVGDKTVTFSAKKAGVTVESDGQAAVRAGKGSFLASGWNYLAGLFGRETQLHCRVDVPQSDYLERFYRDVSRAMDRPVENDSWELDETEDSAELVLHRGRTGQYVDQDQLLKDIAAALENGQVDLTAQVVTQAPERAALSRWKGEIDRQPENATLDVATNEIIPHKLGLLLSDAAEAQRLLDAAAEGETVRVPLEVTEPEITTLDLRASLFRDLLGEASSKISGDANRVGNVRLAAEACNGVVLLPGEQMSYNKTTGQRTAAKGYREASGYTAKGIEDMVGGGVCQPSSTLYLACLNANLEIVERSNHRYTVSYMPDGMDATVSWPNLDYVFANSTPYPLKVVTSIENRVLKVQLFGTKTDDTYVEMESVRLSTTPAGVTYEPDETVPQGTTKVLQGAHTGKKVQVYKNLYQGDGTLISRTLISTDTYRPGDKIVAYNPLDGAPDGSVAPVTDPNAPIVDPMTGFLVDPNTGAVITDPVTGEPMLPTPSPDPGVQPTQDPAQATPPPSVEPTTEPSTEPAPSTEPTAEPSPGVEPSPEPTVPTDPPALPPMPEPVSPEGIPQG